jgi:hypothetical protein
VGEGDGAPDQPVTEELTPDDRQFLPEVLVAWREGFDRTVVEGFSDPDVTIEEGFSVLEKFKAVVTKLGGDPDAEDLGHDVI